MLIEFRGVCGAEQVRLEKPDFILPVRAREQNRTGDEEARLKVHLAKVSAVLSIEVMHLGQTILYAASNSIPLAV
jgi:hypothetical protein